MSGKIMHKSWNEVSTETVINSEKTESLKMDLPFFREITNLPENFKVMGKPAHLKIVLIPVHIREHKRTLKNLSLS
jgi:hypothetical protein